MGLDSTGASDFDTLVLGVSEKRVGVTIETSVVGIVVCTKVTFPVACNVESGVDSFLVDPIALIFKVPLILSSSSPLGEESIVLSVTLES